MQEWALRILKCGTSLPLIEFGRVLILPAATSNDCLELRSCHRNRLDSICFYSWQPGSGVLSVWKINGGDCITNIIDRFRSLITVRDSFVETEEPLALLKMADLRATLVTSNSRQHTNGFGSSAYARYIASKITCFP